MLLFAIAITGLALTASATWWQGRFYWFISLTHQVLVVAWLLSIPFGKFFHIFQRPASMGVTLYQTVNQEQEAAAGVVEVRGSHCALRLGPPVEAVHRGPQGDARRSWAEV